MIKKPLKIVVFDLDETLGYFTEFGIFCDCLNKYFKTNEYSNTKFNELLDLYPAFLRPKIMNILRYLKSKKSENKCYKVMIYTNNQGDKSWAINIKKYFRIYPFKAITELILSPIISLRIASMPFFNVNVEEGHPLHAPCRTTRTVLLSAA